MNGYEFASRLFEGLHCFYNTLDLNMKYENDIFTIMHNDRVHQCVYKIEVDATDRYSVNETDTFYNDYYIRRRRFVKAV